jgi:hypothetical protein
LISENKPRIRSVYKGSGNIDKMVAASKLVINGPIYKKEKETEFFSFLLN